MSYQDIFENMCQEIWEQGREWPNALHEAALAVERAGLMSYDEADEALRLDYDQT